MRMKRYISIDTYEKEELLETKKKIKQQYREIVRRRVWKNICRRQQLLIGRRK